MTAPASAADAHRSGRFGARDIAVAVMMNLLWGLNIIAVKQAVSALPPMTAAAVRQTIVMLVCLPWLRIVPGRMRALGALGVLTGALFLVFVNLSLKVADNVGALAIAGQLGVPFAMLLAVAVLGERIHVWRIAGVAMSLGGVAAMLFDPAIAHELAGIALTAAGCVVWAVSSLIQRSLKGVGVATIMRGSG